MIINVLNNDKHNNNVIVILIMTNFDDDDKLKPTYNTNFARITSK